MTISASLVKELRERTGSGMMECKKALLQANGDIEAAIKAMREAGITKAAKKAGRVTAQGSIEIKISADGHMGIIVEVNSETDFVARDSNFKAFAKTVAETAFDSQVTDLDALAHLNTPEGHTIEQARQALISKLGENVQIRRIGMLKTTGILGSYIHGDRIGVLVALSKADAALAKDIAMHVAAANPQNIHPEEVSQELIQQEKEVFIAQTAESGKSPEIIEKMVQGRINKFLNEITLLGQAFIKDPNETVGNLLKKHQTEVTGFIRFEVGEGIEKQVEDFAEAVKAAQASGGA